MKLSALSPSWLTTASLTSGKILRSADENEYFMVHFYAIFVLYSFVFGSFIDSVGAKLNLCYVKMQLRGK